MSSISSLLPKPKFSSGSRESQPVTESDSQTTITPEELEQVC